MGASKGDEAPNICSMPRSCLTAASLSCVARLPALSSGSLLESMGTGTSLASTFKGAGLVVGGGPGPEAALA